MKTPIEFEKMSPEQLVAFAIEQAQQIDSIQTKLKESETKLQESNKALEDTKKELEETKNELDTTVEINAELSAKVSELSSAAAQSKKPVAAEKIVLPSGTFKVDDVTYGFAFARISTKEHGVITAKEVLASESLQKYLVQVGSGMVKKV